MKNQGAYEKNKLKSNHINYKDNIFIRSINNNNEIDLINDQTIPMKSFQNDYYSRMNQTSNETNSNQYDLLFNFQIYLKNNFKFLLNYRRKSDKL